MSYFNEHQESYMDDLARIPLAGRCWCGWAKAGECRGVACRAGLTCADKCLPCSGFGKRWQPGGYARCPDCAGTGMNDEGGTT